MSAEDPKNNASRIGGELQYLRELSSQHKYKEFWERTQIIKDLFKTIKPILKEDRELLWSDYSNMCETVKQEMRNEHEQKKKNATSIGQEIDNLRYNYRIVDGILPITVGFKYHEFWANAKKISQMFKDLKLIRVDREKLWSNYTLICDEVRRFQDGEREKSRRNREFIEGLISDAYKQAKYAENKEGIDQAKSMQAEILEIMKKEKLIKSDRDECWKRWLELKKRIEDTQYNISEYKYISLKSDADKCLDMAYNDDPHEALNEIKAVQKDLHEAFLYRNRRDQIHGILSKAWDVAISKINAIREEKKRKYLEWKERTESNIERWEKNIQNSENFISRLEEQIRDLEDKAANARTDDFADKVRGWIDEKEEKISEVRGQIRNWEDKIDSARRSVDK